MNPSPYPPVVCLMGPTASGKTALALALAQSLPVEIISVDSALIYREMDIGTAKPDLATRRLIPHRLVDILDPAQAYSAGQFRADALREIVQIHRMGRVPLLVGGTMLYFRALTQGLSRLPSADPAVRARLALALTEQGNTALHARLARVDPIAAGRIHPHDPQRVQRALEVYEITGQSLTELCALPRDESLPWPIIKLIVAPAERSWLHKRIEQRWRDMLEQGFIDEVARLRSRGDLDLDKPSMRAVGYRQVWQYLAGDLDYVAMNERAVIATRQLAKRQMTWLRAEPDTQWLESTDPDLLEKTLNRLRAQGFFLKGTDGL